MFDDIDDLLGGPSTVVEHSVSATGRRAPKGAVKPKAAVRSEKPTKSQKIEDDIDVIGTQNATTLLTGVPIPTLIRIFRMGRGTILEALKNVNPVKLGHNGAPYYDLAEAASYLVAPNVDVATYIARMDPSALPEQLRSAYWDAKLKRQKYEAQAGHLWRSEDVMDVLGETFKIIKDRTQLFVDTLENTTGLSDANRATLNSMVDTMLDEIQQKLVEHSETTHTRSQLSDLDDVQ